MGNFGLVLICIALGLLLRRTGRLPAAAPAVLNGFVLSISLPAMTLLNLHHLELHRRLLFPVGMAWVLFGLGVAYFGVLGRALSWERGAIGALALTAGLSNTSFVGFPLLEALYGPHALATGILTDQPGSFLVLSSLGVLTASILSARSFSAAALGGRLLKFPPFIALIVAVAAQKVEYPAALTVVLEKLASTLSPLALVSVGAQIDFDRRVFRAYRGKLALGLLFKLLVGPALIAALFAGVMGGRGEMIQITIVQAAMAPMITGAILASDYGLEPGLANLMIAVGIPLSLLTVPVWAHFLRGLK